MTLPQSVLMLRDAMLAKFSLPFTAPPSSQKEDIFRQWCIKFAEQLAHTFPNEGWGMKRAEPTRPISKDTVARQLGGQLLIWDLFSGVGAADAAGNGTTTVVPFPDAQDVTGQVFVEVIPMNHLSSPLSVPISSEQVLSLLTAISPVCTQAALAAAEPQLAVSRIALQRNSAGEIRGRIYLPTSTAAGPARVVDVVGRDGWGGPWLWIERGIDDNITIPASQNPPPEPPPPTDLTPVLNLLADIHERLVALETQVVALETQVGELRKQGPPWVLTGAVNFFGNRPITGSVGGQP